MADYVATRRQASTVDLREMTDARVALGRFGAGAPTKAALAFLLDHARAREAVWSSVDRDALTRELELSGRDVVAIKSLAKDRSSYVRRPDLGRQMSSEATEELKAAVADTGGFDIAIIIADGLSSNAVDINAVPVVKALAGRLGDLGLSLAPVVLATQARVALSDPIGTAIGANIAIMLIGERPGLSAADSLGAYITYSPTPGTPDSRRNCISNIRDGGLSPKLAVEQIISLVIAMRQTGVSGVGLRDAAAKLEAQPA